MTAHDLLDCADILRVWAALGGGPLRHGRGRAFWRDGNGWNISLDAEKNCFFDHAAGSGGGVLRLIELALGCDRAEALSWLAAEQGVVLDGREFTSAQRAAWTKQRRADERDLPLARWWARSAAALTEEQLGLLDPADQERAGLTELLRALRSEAGILAEFRTWRKGHPALTAAMVQAGRASEARALRELAPHMEAA